MSLRIADKSSEKAAYFIWENYVPQSRMEHMSGNYHHCAQEVSLILNTKSVHFVLNRCNVRSRPLAG
jgi:hypothetical protein